MLLYTPTFHYKKEFNPLDEGSAFFQKEREKRQEKEKQLEGKKKKKEGRATGVKKERVLRL